MLSLWISLCIQIIGVTIPYPEWSEPEVFQICEVFRFQSIYAHFLGWEALKKIPKSEMLQNPRPFNNYLENLVWGCSTCNIMLKVCLYPRKTMNFVSLLFLLFPHHILSKCQRKMLMNNFFQFCARDTQLALIPAMFIMLLDCTSLPFSGKEKQNASVYLFLLCTLECSSLI